MASRVLTILITVLTLVAVVAPATAHEMTLKGTVQAIEAHRVQVKTGEEKKGQSPSWIGLDAKTKITRDKTPVTLEQAKIAVGERVVAVVDHQTNGTLT